MKKMSSDYLQDYLCTCEVAGHFADSLIIKHKWTTVSVRRSMTSIGLLGPGLFILFFSAVDNLPLAVFFVSLSLGLSACNSSGHLSNHAEIAPNHAGITFAISNTLRTSLHNTKRYFSISVVCNLLLVIYIIKFNIYQVDDILNFSAGVQTKIAIQERDGIYQRDTIQLSSGDANHEQSFNGNELTLVTAYFNIGPFTKTPKLIFSNKTYNNWMKSFQSVNNCVILYTDQMDISVQFKLYRRHFPIHMTNVFILNQTSLWAFRLQPLIKEIYSQKGYPTPGKPAYSSAMHAKYELTGKVIKEHICTTIYLAWIDIGYFRKKRYDCFEMKLPNNMKDDHISFSQVDFVNPNITLKQIMYQTKYYVAGGLFIGKSEYLSLFIEDYQMAVETLLKMKLMNSDQQILYAMYSAKLFFQPRIRIQTFYEDTILRTKRPKRWYYLGELCSNVKKQNISADKCIFS